MKRFLIILLLFPALAFGQNTSADPTKKLGPNPLKIMDSVIISNEAFGHLDANNIASLTILTDTDATNKYGDAAKDGAVIITTKAFAKNHYIAYFRKVSAKYDSLYSITKSDSSFQYIINDKIKTSRDEGDLFIINDEIFISLEILSADDLKTKYGIDNKQYGILINSKIPKNLKHADEKF